MDCVISILMPYRIQIFRTAAIQSSSFAIYAKPYSLPENLDTHVHSYAKKKIR